MIKRSVFFGLLLVMCITAISFAGQDGGCDITSELWAKAVLEVHGNPVTLQWKMVGADITPSGDQVISGYFYADPNDFSYGSQYNPEVFVKIYIAANGWCNMAFNHVTVDDVSVYSMSGEKSQSSTATLNNRLVEHQYDGVGIDDTLQATGDTAAASRSGGYTLSSGLWANAVFQPFTGPVNLIWKQVGTDITPSGDTVISGYFYASPEDFAYGSLCNPEVFVKIYIASNGWANIAFNHVTVDAVEVFSSHEYNGAPDHQDILTLNERLTEHTYTDCEIFFAPENWWEEVQVSAFCSSFAGIIATGLTDPTPKHTEEFYLNLFSQAGVTIANWADIRWANNWEDGYLEYVNKMHNEGFPVIGTASMITVYETPDQHLGHQEPPELLESVINDPFGNLLIDESLADYDLNLVLYVHSMLHPNWQNYLISILKSMIDMGIDGVLIDDMAYGSVFQPDFNPYTMSLFREYLLSTYPQEKLNQLEAEYNISDINEFDYSEFIKNYLPSDMDEISISDWNWEVWGKIPFGFDYERFKRVKNLEVAKKLSNEIKNYAKNNYNRDISISANISDMSSPEALYIVDLIDYCENEIFYYENGYFPNYRGFSTVKLGQAFNKNCNLLTSLSTRSDIASKGKDLTVNLYRTMIADAYSSGGNFTVEEGFWGIELDIDSLDEYFQFPIQNSDFFNDTSPLQGKIGVLYLWENLDVYKALAYRGMSNVLSDSGFQFSVIFGAEEFNPWGNISIYPAPDHPLETEKLNPYSTIIIPELTNLLEKNATLLLQYVQNGGNLLVFATSESLQSIEWQWPDDENVLALIGYLKQSEVSLGKGKIVCKNYIIGTQYLESASIDYRSQLKLTLSNLGLSPEIALSEDRHVLASNSFYGNNKYIVHFVNYDHNSETDTTIPTKSVTASLSLPDNMASNDLSVFFYEPGKDKIEIDYAISDDILILKLPEIYIWGVLVIEAPGYINEDLKSF